MQLKDLLWYRYTAEANAEKVFILKCSYEGCKSKGGLLHRVHSEGVGKGATKAQCSACNRYTLEQIAPDKLTDEQLRNCLIRPALLSSKELAPLAKPFVVEGVSSGVVALFVVAAAGELHYRARIGTGGGSQKSKYNAYIKPPGETDIWLASAVMTALRVEGNAPGSTGAPVSGSVGVCLRSDGTAAIGFSGDSSKALKYSALLKDFLPLFKGLYPKTTLTLAMAENTDLIKEYYQSFKTVKGGAAEKSTWERHCAESKFLDLSTVKRQPMSSCTVLWIGTNAMNGDFCLLPGRSALGDPMLPCGHCQQLHKFLDER